MTVDDEKPEIEQVTGLVARSVQKRHRLLDGHFVQGVNADARVRGQIPVLLVSPEERALFDRQNDAFMESDVRLDGLAGGAGERPLVRQVEGVTVLVRMTIQAVEPNLHAGPAPGFLERRGEPTLDLLPRRVLYQREVQVLRESVVREITLLQGGPAFESKPIPERRV